MENVGKDISRKTTLLQPKTPANKQKTHHQLQKYHL